MNIELKPCPFCGHEPELRCVSKASLSSGAPFVFSKTYKLWCPHCGCTTSSNITVRFDYYQYAGLKADESELVKAIERWNRRANEKDS